MATLVSNESTLSLADLSIWCSSSCLDWIEYCCPLVIPGLDQLVVDLRACGWACLAWCLGPHSLPAGLPPGWPGQSCSEAHLMGSWGFMTWAISRSFFGQGASYLPAVLSESIAEKKTKGIFCSPLSPC